MKLNYFVIIFSLLILSACGPKIAVVNSYNTTLNEYYNSKAYTIKINETIFDVGDLAPQEFTEFQTLKNSENLTVVEYRDETNLIYSNSGLRKLSQYNRYFYDIAGGTIYPYYLTP